MRDEDIPMMLTIDEAAPYLRMTPSGLRRLVRRGDVKASHVGRRWLISKEELLRVLREGSEPVELAGGRKHPRVASEPEPGEDDAEMQVAPPRAGRRASFDGAPVGFRLIS